MCGKFLTPFVKWRESWWLFALILKIAVLMKNNENWITEKGLAAKGAIILLND